MKNYRTFKYLIKPNKKQKEEIDKILKDVNLVRKLCIEEFLDEKYVKRQYKDMIWDYKRKYPGLANSDSSALINVLFKVGDLRKQNILKKIRKKNVYSYTTSFLNSRLSVRLYNPNHIFLPNVGLVKMVMHRRIPDNYRLMNCSVNKEKHNIYTVCIHTENEEEIIVKTIDKTKTIGLDYSNKHFIVDSNGIKYNLPHFYRDRELVIKELQRSLMNCHKESSNYYKIKRRLDKIFLRIRNIRNDYLHKLSTNLVNEYDVIAVESLDLKEIAKVRNIAKATMDNAYGKFCEILEYKCRNKGKKLIKVSKWFASSKICSKCGYINHNLKLSDKEWICPDCFSVLDRDINAAINIKNEGLRLLP